MNPERVSACQP